MLTKNFNNFIEFSNEPEKGMRIVTTFEGEIQVRPRI